MRNLQMDVYVMGILWIIFGMAFLAWAYWGNWK